MSGQPWSKEDEAKLREAFSRSTNVKDHLHLFPGRTPNSIRSKAQSMGIEMVDWRAWTKSELKNIKLMMDGGKTVKGSMHLFPGRTVTAVKQKITYMGLKKVRGHYSWVWDAIRRELACSPGITGRILEEKIGCCHRQVMDRLYQHSTCDNKEVYVSGWVRSHPKHKNPGPWVQCWTLGNEPDAPKPTPMTDEDRRRRDRLSYRKKAKKHDPFAVAAGLVKPVSTTERGRVYTQDMGVDEWSQSRAA